ncbi:hypothetical protein OR571_04905 [Psychrobacillus sp. NEAU-3TGS]|uniref:hypothetical protein n=1 Tax=Psychrobacillus sp. NEAU-3TGS TaxID=2995412 RepID=UPI0024975926|nr:hypothetical protein [Psychrobacillus sp. NEAU-3TGS]MDI2586487.1 hypothetical protein [Psychrobacillus sp. NEAU-3TGS]
MYKRVVQAAIMFGILSVPTFASADGGLLRNTLNKSSNLIETVTDSVSEVQLTEKVAETEELIQPVRKVVNTLDETTEKLTETVKSEKPIVDLNVSSNPSIGVNLGVVESEVSKTPTVKVDTSIVKVEVDDTAKIEADLLEAHTQELNKKHPQVSVKTPIIDVETIRTEQSTPNTNSDLPKTATALSLLEPDNVAQKKEIVIPEIEQPIQHEQPILMDEPEIGFESEDLQKSYLGEVVTKPLDTAPKRDIKKKKEKRPESFPKIPSEDYNQLKVVPTFQSGPSTPTQTGGSGGPMPFATMNEMAMAFESRGAIFPTMTRLLYDQWLNAPPFQPPRQSLFSISSI